MAVASGSRPAEGVRMGTKVDAPEPDFRRCMKVPGLTTAELSEVGGVGLGRASLSAEAASSAVRGEASFRLKNGPSVRRAGIWTDVKQEGHCVRCPAILSGARSRFPHWQAKRIVIFAVPWLTTRRRAREEPISRANRRPVPVFYEPPIYHKRPPVVIGATIKGQQPGGSTRRGDVYD